MEPIPNLKAELALNWEAEEIPVPDLLLDPNRELIRQLVHRDDSKTSESITIRFIVLRCRFGA